MRANRSGVDHFDAWAWRLAAMSFAWYVVAGSIAHASLWILLTLLGIDILSTTTYLVFVIVVAAVVVVRAYSQAGRRLRDELMDFYGELDEELVSAAVRHALAAADQPDISLAGIRRDARGSLARRLERSRFEIIDRRRLLEVVAGPGG